MVSLHGISHRRMSGASASNRSSVDETRSDGAEDESQVVEPEQGNVLSHIIANLRPGADLSRVVLPTFILEPRSMLERITNFMAHPETLLPMPEIDDPEERFVSVVKFYLSGWHIKPPGVKKPLNPILGETYSCYWTYPDGTKGYYIAEQTSHHPPKSSYFYMAPEHHIRVDGCLKPRSKFLGNSAASLMEGISVLRFLNRGSGPKGESYYLTQPNMYARGILFGKMKYELGDHSFVKCPELGLSADIEFKVKGYFSGSYNAIGGFIKNENTGQNLYELSGVWNGEMFIKDLKTGKKDLLFDATRAKHTPPSVRPMEEQTDRESQKLWYSTAQAVIARNHDLATDEKTKIEDTQRAEAAQRASSGEEWLPKLFRPIQGGPGGPDEGEENLEWLLNAVIDGDSPEKQIEQILAVTPILPGQTATQSEKVHTQPSSNENQPPQQDSQSQAQQHEQPDLIDFGQSDNTVPVSITSNAGPVHTQPQSQSISHAQPHSPPQPHQQGELTLQEYQNQASQPSASEAERPKPAYMPTDLHVAQTENGGLRQKELEQKLETTSITPPKGAALTQLEQDLQREQVSKTKQSALGRADSKDDSDDEFVDAQG